jgi:cbb3-type cytochrome oxidase maturation protein
LFTSTLILVLLSLFLGAGTWLFFLWAVQKGEFDDVEGPKHRMLDDEPTPPEAGGSASLDDHDDLAPGC